MREKESENIYTHTYITTELIDERGDQKIKNVTRCS